MKVIKYRKIILSKYYDFDTIRVKNIDALTEVLERKTNATDLVILPNREDTCPGEVHFTIVGEGTDIQKVIDDMAGKVKKLFELLNKVAYQKRLLNILE